jgi:hypothetical protein
VELSDLLASAWAAVEQSRVPAEQQSVAFREAISILREDGVPSPGGGSNGVRKGAAGKKAAGKKAAAPSRRRKNDSTSEDGASVEVPSEAEFFAQLADESAVDETDLRDVLQLRPNGDIHVTPATRKLGESKQQQTATIAALVGGARAFGLQESPIDGKKVREEVQRKNAFNGPNYSKHLSRLKGMNKGANDTLVPTSKWIDDFKPAVDQALGRSGDGN